MSEFEDILKETIEFLAISMKNKARKKKDDLFLMKKFTVL